MKLSIKVELRGPNARDAFLRDLRDLLLRHAAIEGKVTITQEAEIFASFPLDLALLGVEEPNATPIERAIDDTRPPIPFRTVFGSRHDDETPNGSGVLS